MKRRDINRIKFCCMADFASDKPPQTRPGGSVWIETPFEGYYWKLEARRTKRMKRKRKMKKGNPPPSRARPSLRELGQAELSKARPELGRFRHSSLFRRQRSFVHSNSIRDYFCSVLELPEAFSSSTRSETTMC